MEIILQATPKGGKLIFSNQNDYKLFCEQYEGEEQTVKMQSTSKTSAKIRMFAYLHAPLLDAAVIGFTNAGYEGIDRVSALYKLKAMFLKSVLYNSKTGEEEYYIEELSKANKERLLKFITDCCFFLESELQITPPDVEQWKQYKLTGKNFQSVKNFVHK